MAHELIATVPFVAWRCPSCGNAKPRTYGQEGRIRFHRCVCGATYRSLELPPSDLRLHPAFRNADYLSDIVSMTTPSVRHGDRIDAVELAGRLNIPPSSLCRASRLLQIQHGFPRGLPLKGGARAWSRSLVDDYLTKPGAAERLRQAVAEFDKSAPAQVGASITFGKDKGGNRGNR